MFPQQQSNANTATMTNLVDVAAAIEDRLHNAEVHVQALQRDLQQARQRHDQAHRWILGIRKYHRSHSHATTGRVIKSALEWFETSSQTIGLSLF